MPYFAFLHFITQPHRICTRLRWLCLGVSSNGRKFSSPQGFTASLVRGSEQQWPCHSVRGGLANSKPVLPRILVTPVTKAVTRWCRWESTLKLLRVICSRVWVVATLKEEPISGIPHGVAFVRRHKKVDVFGCWVLTTSGSNYNPSDQEIPVRDFFFLKSFKVGIPSCNSNLWDGRYTFNPDLLRWEHPPFIWATPSSGRFYKRHIKDGSSFSLYALSLAGKAFLHQQESPLLQHSGLYWRPAELYSLRDWILGPSLGRQPLVD